MVAYKVTLRTSETYLESRRVGGFQNRLGVRELIGGPGCGRMERTRVLRCYGYVTEGHLLEATSRRAL